MMMMMMMLMMMMMMMMTIVVIDGDDADDGRAASSRDHGKSDINKKNKGGWSCIRECRPTSRTHGPLPSRGWRAWP